SSEREKALRDCTAEAGKLRQSTWGDHQIQKYRSCMMHTASRNNGDRLMVFRPASKPLPTPPNVLPIWPKPDQRRRNATASNRPHSDLSVLPPPSRVRSRL